MPEETSAEVLIPESPEPAAPESALIGEKPVEETAPAEQPAGEQKTVPGAPEEYKFEFSEDAKVDPEAIEGFSKVAKELDIPQETAQKLAEHGVEVVKKAADSVVSNLNKEFNNLRNEWKSELSQDPEFGGAKQAETITRAQRVLDEVFPPRFKSFLSQGIGDNADLIIGLAKIDKMLGENRVPDGKSTEPPSGGNLWDGLYGNSNMNKS